MYIEFQWDFFNVISVQTLNFLHEFFTTFLADLQPTHWQRTTPYNDDEDDKTFKSL